VKLVNRIRQRVKEWRTHKPDPYPGVSRTTLELLKYWRRDGRQQRLFFAQLEAAETIIFLTEARADFRQGIDIPLDEPSDERKADGGVARRLVREKGLPLVGPGRGPRVAVLAEEEEMRGDEAERQYREEDDVYGVETRKRRGTDHGSSCHDARGRGPDDGQRRGHSRPDDRRPVGLLVPREEVSREAECEDHEEERDAHEPVQLARLEVRPEEERPREVEDREDDDRGRAPVMEAAHERSRGKPRLNRLHALPRVIRRGGIGEREREAGGELDEERDERRGAQCEEPRPPDGNRLVRERAPERRERGARLQEFEEPLHASSAEASSCTRPPITTSGKRVRGRGGGPASTAPSGP